MILYLLYNPTTKYTKIGITENLEERIIKLENTCGCNLKLISYAEIDHAFETERFLHATFDNYRVKGEWFSFTDRAYEFLAHFWYEYFKINSDSIFNSTVPIETYIINEEENIEGQLLFFDRVWENEDEKEKN